MGKEIGIDLGTTNTIVSYVNKKGKLRQLRYNAQEKIIPSAIYFISESEYFIGNRAKALKSMHPQAYVENFKTQIGSSERYEIIPENGKPFRKRARDIAKLFLNKIIVDLQNELIKEFGPIEGTVSRAVITVPANFSSTEKSNTKTAAREAGFDDIKLTAEPTAAAIAYENSQGDEDSESVILVYDFGGGTFDVSIMRRKNGAFEEIMTGGDKRLGGNTFTNILAKEILNRINDDYGLNYPFDEDDFDEENCKISLNEYRKNIESVWDATNTIKEELSDEDEVSGEVNIFFPNSKNRMITIEFTREELENYVRAEIERTVAITLKTIQAAKNKGIEHIDQIVLAGGSSNIPLVKQTLENRLSDQDIVFCDDVSTLISRGAAILAKRYVEFENISKAITTVQMGIVATEGIHFGKFQVIIPEDEPLPCVRKKTFYLPQDNMKKFEIKYYERDIKNFTNATYVRDDGIEEIDSVMIENLPPNLKASDVQVEVTFTAQKDGSLDINVEIKDNAGKKIHGDKLIARKKSDVE